MPERRLGDRVLEALELALEQEDLEVAEHLGRALELALTRFGGAGKVEHREPPPGAEAALDRLEALKQRFFAG